MSRREIVHQGFDSMLAQVLCDVLRQEGLDAQLRGGHASSIFGAGQSYLEVVIDTPAEQAERGRELVAAYQQQDDGEEDDEVEAPPAPIIAPEVRLPRPRPPMFAPGLACIIPGGGHLYAFRSLTGVGLLCAQIGVAVTALTQDRRTAGALTMLGLLIFDMIGGVRATRDYNRGVRWSAPRQLGVVAVALVVAGGIGLAAAPHVQTWRMPRPVRDLPSDEGAAVHGGEAPHPEDLPFPLHLDIDGRQARN